MAWSRGLDESPAGADSSAAPSAAPGPTPFERRAAAILAAGRSRRFGRNKALAPWGSARVIDAIIQTLRAVCPTILIVANEKTFFLDTGVDVVPDTFPGCGPLAGLHSALKTLHADRILVVGCDMPLLHPGLLAWMWGLPTWAPVVVPRLDSGYEPLHAIYHSSLLRIVEYRLRAGAFGLQRLIRDLPHRTVTEASIRRFCPDLSCLASANTVEDLRLLKEKGRKGRR